MTLQDCIAFSNPTISAKDRDDVCSLNINSFQELSRLSSVAQQRWLLTAPKTRVSTCLRVPANRLLIGYYAGQISTLVTPHLIHVAQTYRCIEVTDPDVLDIGYLAWYLTLPPLQGWFRKFETGSTFVRLDTKAITTLALPKVPLDKQRKLAEVVNQIRQKAEVEANIARLREEMLSLSIYLHEHP